MSVCSPQRCLIALICGGFVAGCSEDEVTRVAVSGSVTNEASGEVNGVIRFVPKASGPSATADIKDGKFSFTEATGPTAGEYEVFVEPVVASKRMFLATAGKTKGKEGDEASPATPAWKFSVNVSEDTTELETLKLSDESAVKAE